MDLSAPTFVRAADLRAGDLVLAKTVRDEHTLRVVSNESLGRGLRGQKIICKDIGAPDSRPYVFYTEAGRAVPRVATAAELNVEG